MKIGLVLEGGANRGVFTSGVLDYFMEQDLGKAFRYVIGTSAGAGNAMNFISGQHGRSRDTTITKDKRYAYFGLEKYHSDRASVRHGKYLLEGAHRI